MRDPNYDEFCRDSAESYIRVGDFDGDLRMDLACIPQPGHIHLALTNGDGFLVNRDFALPDEDRRVQTKKSGTYLQLKACNVLV